MNCSIKTSLPLRNKTYHSYDFYPKKVKKARNDTTLNSIRNPPKCIETIGPTKRETCKTSQDSFYIGIASLETKLKSKKENEAPSDW